MNGELFGLGRSWWVAILIIVGATVGWVAKVLPTDQWIDLVKWIFTATVAAKAIPKIINK